MAIPKMAAVFILLSGTYKIDKGPVGVGSVTIAPCQLSSEIRLEQATFLAEVRNGLSAIAHCEQMVSSWSRISNKVLSQDKYSKE